MVDQGDRIAVLETGANRSDEMAEAASRRRSQGIVCPSAITSSSSSSALGMADDPHQGALGSIAPESCDDLTVAVES
jgi:hypothetical protein